MLLFSRRCIKETIENPRTDLSCELKPETGLVFGKSPKPYSRRSKGHLDRGFHRGHSWTNIHPTPVPQQYNRALRRCHVGFDPPKAIREPINRSTGPKIPIEQIKGTKQIDPPTCKQIPGGIKIHKLKILLYSNV